jgi:hypothetical protein
MQSQSNIHSTSVARVLAALYETLCRLRSVRCLLENAVRFIRFDLHEAVAVVYIGRAMCTRAKTVNIKRGEIAVLFLI